MKTVNGSTTADYCYGRFNRLSGYYTTGSCSSPNVSYTYDANGNTATKTGGWTYSYDYENRLTKVTQSGATKQQDSYDGDGNRVKQVAGSTTNTYFYQGLNILYEKNVTGSTTTVTKHFYAGGVQVAKMVGSSVYYLHQDALGNTRLETTSTVAIKFKSDYVPYGTAYQPTGSEVFRYTGKPYDAATGLYYMGARYYDPATGRFITQDSYPGSMSDPSSMNLYAYARDNPMRYTDPSGHLSMVNRYDFGGTTDPTYRIITGTTCSGAACTVTTTATYDGYASTISTAISSFTSAAVGPTRASVITTTSFTTTMTDTNPGGSTRTTSSTSKTTSTDTEPTIGTSPTGGSCTAAANVCAVLNYDPTRTGGNPYLKMAEGSLIVVLGVYLTFLMKGGAPPPGSGSSGLPPPPHNLPGPFIVIAFGLSLVFSGSAQLGYEYGSEHGLSSPLWGLGPIPGASGYL